MNFITITLALLVFGIGISEDAAFDFNGAIPIQYHEKFWDNKPAALRPPKKFFEQYRNGMHRIIGGSQATPGQFPYIAAVYMDIPGIGEIVCSGSLVAVRTVLTAAHCVDGATNGIIILGAHNATDATEPNQLVILVSRNNIVMHEDYSSWLLRNDIAVIHLPSPVQLQRGVIETIALPSFYDNPTLFAGYSGTLVGWGYENNGNLPDIVRFTVDNIMPNGNCQNFFGSFMVIHSNICFDGANGRGACNGDSGGPLTAWTAQGRNIQVGIVSFGNPSNGCVNTSPSVCARTTSHFNWLYFNVF